MRESVIQNKVKSRYESDGWLVVKIIQCTLNGWPDLQCHKSGITIFIETKATNGKLSPLQIYRHQQLRAAGFQVLVINSV